ncbi:twin-arginine translocase TatA/TatE family subunit [Nitrososphaera sp.]|uniref:twin-arginine translocase TatA/TatE family subunit n=1 Tax=Nitrososphaera sp. TaxID=1971748 RepID=UPI00307F7149
MIPSLLQIIPSGMEWVLIVGAIVVVFFGVKKVPELARSFGKASGEYEKARMEAKREIDELKRQAKDGAGGIGSA